MDSYKKPVVAIYPQHYLTVSMTFVYRQLMGIADDFYPIVFASSVDNLDIYPFDPIFLAETKNIEKVVCKLYKLTTGRYTFLSPLKAKYWKDILKAYNVKLVHAHFGPSGLEIFPLTKALRIPLVVTFHGFDASHLLRDRRYLSDLKRLFRNAYIITVSKTMRDRLIESGADPSKVEVHYIGVPIEDFYYTKRVPVKEKVKSESTLEFLQISNFVEKKGHKYTIEAFRNFLSSYPNSRLTLAGDGPLRREIETICSNLSIEEKVRFVGKISKEEVITLMMKADVFLHHSVTAENGDQEGIPTVIMEAMATGLIVISTFHSGIPELINDGFNGYLVEEKDVKSYTAKMVGVLDCGVDVGQRAFNTIKERFNISKQNIKLKEIYRKVANGFV